MYTPRETTSGSNPTLCHELLLCLLGNALREAAVRPWPSPNVTACRRQTVGPGSVNRVVAVGDQKPRPADPSGVRAAVHISVGVTDRSRIAA